MNNKKIRILHVINSFEVGGAEYLLMNICKAYQDSNTEIVVAYLTGMGSILQGVTLPTTVYDLSKDGRFTPFCFISFFKIIQRHNIRILHTHDPQSGIIARCVAMVMKVNFIVTTRHNPDLIGNSPFVYKIENYFLQKNSFVIAISNAVRLRLIEQYHIKPEKIRVIYNGIDISRFTSKTQNQHDEKHRTIVVGTISRLTKQKGTDILIYAFERFSRNNKDAVMYIGGDGPEMASLKQLVDTLNIRNKVKFVGMLSEHDVVEYLKTIDIFVLASRWEGFGISLIEAMAMGKVVIGSNVDGIREIVNHEENGLLFPKEDIVALAELLATISHDTSLQLKLRNNAQETVRLKFTVEQYCMQLVETYRNLIIHDIQPEN